LSCPAPPPCRPPSPTRRSSDLMMGKRAAPAIATPRESGDAFRLLVEGVRDYAIVMLDGAGRVSTWNTGAQHINGYRAEEIVGQQDRKSTRLNSSHEWISYAVFC